MKQKWGIRKTKMNIFLLFLCGTLIGIIIGLRQPQPTITTVSTPAMEQTK